MQLINKFKEKRFVQNLIIELIADSVMVIAGITIGYFFKTMMF